MNKIYCVFILVLVFGALLPVSQAHAEDTAKPDSSAQQATPAHVVDANRDGSVSREEARAAMNRRFNKLDQNGDMKIDRTESFAPLELLKASNPDFPADRIAQLKAKMETMFMAWDADSDGVISRAEYDEMALREHNALDIDGDGNVTREEVKTRQEEFRERMKAARARSNATGN